MSEQSLAIPLVRDLRGMREQLVKRSVLRDQIARAFLANARYALDVVDGIPLQRKDVDDLGRRRSEFILHSFGVVPGSVDGRVVDLLAFVQELKVVLILWWDGD